MINVLIVEDDYRIANIHEKFLEELGGMKVVGKALTGKEALQIAYQHKVDLILLDLYLPDISGEELICELRDINRELDFIVISAASEKEIVGSLIRSGIFDYIIKPVIKERLLEAMQRYIGFNERLNKEQVIEQDFLDGFFGYEPNEEKTTVQSKKTPKGIDPLTLEKVKEIVEETVEGITAEKMGEKIGASRTTARRYLEFLTAEEEVIADLQYGAIGRPERIYYKIGLGEIE